MRRLAPALSLWLAFAALSGVGGAAVSKQAESESSADDRRLAFDLSLDRFDRMPNGSIRYFNEVLDHERQGVSILTLSAVRRQDRRKLGFAVDGRLGTRPEGARIVEIRMSLVDDGREMERREIRGLRLSPGESTPFASELWLGRREFEEAFGSGRAPRLHIELIVGERD